MILYSTNTALLVATLAAIIQSHSFKATTQKQPVKPIKQNLVKPFKYPVAPSLMNFRASYTNFMTKYPYWGHYENYFLEENVLHSEKIKIHSGLQP